MLKQSYLSVLWLVIALFLVFILARRVDTFPMVLWKEEDYIKKKNVYKSEKLFDKTLVRFGKSRERERKYVERVEGIAFSLEQLEKETELIKHVEQENKERVTANKKETRVSTNVESVSYEQALLKYKQAFREYLAMQPQERELYKQKLEDLKKTLLNTLNKGKEGRLFR